MSEPYPGLEIAEDMGHQQWQWRLERLGLVLMTALLVAAVAGLLGPGLFSRRQVIAPDAALIVEFDRTLRIQTPATLDVRVVRPAGSSVELTIGRDFLDRISLERIRPEPRESRLAADGVTWRFDLEPGTDRAVVRFEFAPAVAGRLEAIVRAGSAGEVRAPMFVMP